MKKLAFVAFAMLFSGISLFAQTPVKPTKQDTAKTKKMNAQKVQYTCTMHPEVLSDKPGKCPKCGMTLVKKEAPKKKTGKMKM
jgi:uncharacterized paraquat-inducible protein A